ncbi:hypothetical protein KCP73_17635 [Salmonella enterica subsp. enterica]|nr:hypothetical protein KCP73_17635 [Salmonella enterica subsp. enterica]
MSAPASVFHPQPGLNYQRLSGEGASVRRLEYEASGDDRQMLCGVAVLSQIAHASLSPMIG